MGIKLKFILVFVFLKTFCFCQSDNYLGDSLIFDISFNEEKNILTLEFTNHSKNILVLPWKDHYPYTDFDEEIAKCNIYLGYDDKITLLKIKENTPLYVLEENNISIETGKTINRIIEMKNLLSSNEIKQYDFIFVQYSFINPCKTDYIPLTSSKINLKIYKKR